MSGCRHHNGRNRDSHSYDGCHRSSHHCDSRQARWQCLTSTACDPPFTYAGAHANRQTHRTDLDAGGDLTTYAYRNIRNRTCPTPDPPNLGHRMTYACQAYTTGGIAALSHCAVVRLAVYVCLGIRTIDVAVRRVSSMTVMCERLLTRTRPRSSHRPNPVVAAPIV